MEMNAHAKGMRAFRDSTARSYRRTNKGKSRKVLVNRRRKEPTLQSKEANDGAEASQARLEQLAAASDINEDRLKYLLFKYQFFGVD